MAEANDKYGIIYQNLVDAGCNQKTIQCCMKLAQENNVEALLSQLCMYRKHLMEQTHIYQDAVRRTSFGVVKLNCVVRPASPGMRQYVCQPGACSSTTARRFSA